MKKISIILAIIIIALICKLNQQAEIISALGTQATQQAQVFERVLEQVEQDNPNYVTDVLSETDVYFNYVETIKF
jgi:hypothetical protein